MILAYTIQLLPSVGGVALVITGLVAAMGYARTQAQKVWRESSEGWKAENEINKVKAERLTDELSRAVFELKDARRRTDITAVLNTLKDQNVESTALLTRIADESAARNGHIAKVLADSNERVALILAGSNERATREHLETMHAIKNISTEKTLQKVVEQKPHGGTT